MNKLFLMIALSLFAGTVRAGDLREDLLKAAQKHDAEFPDGKGSQLTHFSHTCNLKTNGGVIHVVDQRAVLTGMPAPRGQNQITFYDQKLKLLGRLRYVQSRPLWCEGATLYLFGGLDGGEPCTTGRDCNAVEWDPNAKKLKSFHAKKYGSSGGAEDP